MAIRRDLTAAEGNSAGDAVLLSEDHVGPEQCERHGSRPKLYRMWQNPTFLRYLRRKYAGPSDNKIEGPCTPHSLWTTLLDVLDGPAAPRYRSK